MSHEDLKSRFTIPAPPSRAAFPSSNPGQWFRDNLLAGLLVTAPIGITLYILWFVFDHVDAPLGDRINASLQSATGMDVHIPGLGVLATLGLLLVVGWLTRIALFRFLLKQVERALSSVPVVRSLYSASRQIMKPFAQNEALPFSEVCLVEYPMAGRFTLGMIARKRVSPDPDDDRIVVFFPSNHLHLGYPVILRRHEVQVIDMSVEDAIKFFVSCGVLADDARFLPRHRDLYPPSVEERIRAIQA